ncbi:alpha/beta fold hydrolase [Micromonospora sp. B11E3]|uniref:alpha/beta fold hydrolase n=1 Tax=Micromonospora sp. B11E3 TaxID=3153562 RepID=UPI00325E5217
MLDVGDDNHVYWAVSGNPDGAPALVVHGGPGAGSGTGIRRLFDPARYRVVQFDQRGCGRSTPHAADPATDMRHNTTEHLLADMERLREHLGIARWLLFGDSWGATLGLAYAQRHPRRVSAIVLVGVTMSRRSEIDWLYRGVGRFFPEQWQRFRDAVPEADRDGDLLAAYARLLGHPDVEVRHRAANAWLAWRTRSSRWRPTAGRTPTATGRRTPGWRSPASAPTTSPTAPGSTRTPCCAAPGGSPASPACSCTAASTSARRWRRPGPWPARGPTPNWSWSPTPGTPAATPCAGTCAPPPRPVRRVGRPLSASPGRLARRAATARILCAKGRLLPRRGSV